MTNRDYNIFYRVLTIKYVLFLLYIVFSYKPFVYLGTIASVGILFSCARFLKYHSLQRSVLLFYGFLIVALTVLGFYYQNWIKYIIGDILVWSLGMVVVVCCQDRDDLFTRDFLNVVAGWMIVGVPLSWYLFYSCGYSPADWSSGERFVYEADLSQRVYGIFLPIQPIYASVYILPFISRLRGLRKIAVLMGAGTILMFGLLTVTRQFVIAPVVGFGSIILSEKKILGVTMMRYMRFLLAVFALFAAIWVILFGYDSLLASVYSFRDRMLFSDLSRNAELGVYWEDQSSVHKLIGHGMGGSNQTGIWADLPYGVAMLHLGLGDVMLKGGILFAGFIYILTMYALWTLWKHPEKHSWFWVLVLFTLTCYAHTEWGRFDAVIFFWLAISQAIGCSNGRGLLPRNWSNCGENPYRTARPIYSAHSDASNCNARDD